MRKWLILAGAVLVITVLSSGMTMASEGVYIPLLNMNFRNIVRSIGSSRVVSEYLRNIIVDTRPLIPESVRIDKEIRACVSAQRSI